MKLTYIYHSGFAIEAEEVTIIIDYYQDSSETHPDQGVVHDYLLQRPGKIYVLSTHFHADHFNRDILAWKERRPDIIYLFSRDILAQKKASKAEGNYIRKSQVYKDDQLRIEAFGSTDAGISYLIDVQGLRIFHAGDLNNWHWSEESTEKEVRKAEGDFLAEVKLLQAKAPAIDVVMFPVDSRLGKDYFRGATQFVERIKTSIFVPMHFGEDYKGGNAFAETAGKYGCRFITITQRGETFDINK